MLFWLVLRIKQEILKHVKTVLTSLVLKDITVLSHMSILHYRKKNALTRTQNSKALPASRTHIHYPLQQAYTLPLRPSHPGACGFFLLIKGRFLETLNLRLNLT